MGEKSRVVVSPVRGNTDASVIESRTRRGIERERSPEADQDQNESNHLRPYACESQQKEEDVTQSDLGESVFEGEVGLTRRQRPQENSKEDENECAADG